MLTFRIDGAGQTQVKDKSRNPTAVNTYIHIHTYTRTVGQAEEGGGGVHNIYFWILIKSIKPIIKQEQEEDDQRAAQ